MDQSRLFKPMKIGNVEVKHRIGMPGLTRFRATEQHVPTAMMKEYYGQRAAVPGTLIISEGTAISAAHVGVSSGVGIWNDEQVSAWKDIVDEVHRKGCFMFCELAGFGRTAWPELAKAEGFPIIAPSAIPYEEGAPIPREMTIEEVKQVQQDFINAAKNAMKAGFDGIEFHGAHGYLIDQFIQDVSNQRTDEYGGSVENRSRFIIEIMEALVDVVGAERLGLRLSPWGTFLGMKMKDPIPQFTDVMRKANALNIAYIHLIESRVAGYDDSDGTEKLDFAYDVWKGPMLINGGYDAEKARKLVDEEHPDKDILVTYGRFFVSNPDLVYRVRHGLKFNPYDRKTFYTPQNPVGYIDYPFSEEYLASIKA